MGVGEARYPDHCHCHVSAEPALGSFPHMPATGPAHGPAHTSPKPKHRITLDHSMTARYSRIVPGTPNHEASSHLTSPHLTAPHHLPSLTSARLTSLASLTSLSPRPAFSALSEAVKHKRDSWQTWENYARAALASGHYQAALRGLQRVRDGGGRGGGKEGWDAVCGGVASGYTGTQECGLTRGAAYRRFRDKGNGSRPWGWHATPCGKRGAPDLRQLRQDPM